MFAPPRSALGGVYFNWLRFPDLFNRIDVGRASKLKGNTTSMDG
ncbi:hypothetical protein [Hydrogenophaga sp. PAMC20947]|nr:hypothetical protein [Hydrogenophaga sp. PAMC20947]